MGGRTRVVVARMFLLLWLLSCAAVAPGQELVIPDVSYPALPAAAADARGFAPAGWRVDRSARGDLNGDGVADLAFVLRMQDPRNVLTHDGLGSNPFDTNPRILAVALAEPGGGYRRAMQNHVLIPRREYPTAEDPFFVDDTEFRIVRNSLRLSLYRFMNAGGWGMGSTAFTFRWRDGALRLVGYDYINVRRNTGELVDLSINFLTRRARIATGRIDRDDEDVRWTRIAARPLLTIDEVGDGLAFDPQGMVSALP